jgi:Sec-independent protein translocase protein TatA
MLPTTEEWVVIGAALVIVLLASRLGDIGDALGRLIKGPAKD